jgi:hypothetical protein
MAERPELNPGIVVGTLVFASTAVWVAALVATLSGALSPWVSAGSLLIGAAAGALAAGGGDGTRPALASPSGLLSRVRALPLADAGALALFAAVSLRQFGWLLFERGGLLETLLANNYGDLPLHWTYTRYLASGAPFWPDNPIISGERLRYPFGVDLLTALFVSLGAGMRVLLPAMGLVGAALGASALRRWGGALAVAGFVFAGGLAGFQVLWTGQVLDYQDAVAWKNLFLALFVPQRGLLLALPVGLVLLWSWRRRLLRAEAGLAPWVEGVLWGALPLVHLHTFLVVSLLYAIWALGGGRLGRAWSALAWAVVPATWAVWQVSDGFGAVSLVGWAWGWMIGSDNPLVFLLVNFGLFLPLALGALVVAWRERHREDLLVLGPALLILAALFVVRLAPWAWDNTKVMLWSYLLALPSIGTLVLARLGRWWRGAAVVGLLFSGAVSVVAASIGGGPRLDVLDLEEYPAVCQALEPQPPGARVATAPTFNHPVALCGHPLVLGYGGHLWSHGIDGSGVERQLGVLMRGEDGWRESARAVEARLLFWGPRERRAFPGSLRPWEEVGPPLAAGAWGAVYALPSGADRD